MREVQSIELTGKQPSIQLIDIPASRMKWLCYTRRECILTSSHPQGRISANIYQHLQISTLEVWIMNPKVKVKGFYRGWAWQCISVTPVLERRRQENLKFWDKLSYTATLPQRKKKKTSNEKSCHREAKIQQQLDNFTTTKTSLLTHFVPSYLHHVFISLSFTQKDSTYLIGLLSYQMI